jgi:ABC-2 type transport system ATP-binding protein
VSPPHPSQPDEISFGPAPDGAQADGVQADGQQADGQQADGELDARREAELRWSARAEPPAEAPAEPRPRLPVQAPAGIRPEARAEDRAGPLAEAGAEPAGELAIATRGLTKRFRSGQLAVDNLSLAVPHGSVYGFLGPNGSGKTTTIRMLLGLVQPTSGRHQLLGVDMPEGANDVLPRVGSLVEGPAFYSFLSGRANLARVDAADRTVNPRTADARIGEALERVGLTAAAAKHYRAYSLGMKQRLAIAAGLLRHRDLMILDEPTNGLDPQGTREVRGLIRQIAGDGTTVFVSSHLLAEVEQICSHVGVMRAGQLVFEGMLDELRGRGAAGIRIRTADAALAAKVLGDLGLADIQTAGDQVSARLDDQAPEDINAALVYGGVRVAGLDTQRPSLEDLFVELTGEGFDVNG